MKLKAIEKPKGEEECPIVWRCYTCGNTEGFITEWYPAGDCDVFCNKCQSANTAEDGQGEPECDCGCFGWECDECGQFMCTECWTWKVIDDESKEEGMCKACNP